ncbi:MAG: protein translocase subunit SecF [Rhodothermia bacterium]|nr:protein translocase subunit SecF [Rhodothermia bacterium]
MRILENSNLQLVGSRTKGYVFSAVLLVASIVAFATKGLEMGIDFQGGMEFVVATTDPLDAVSVREALSSQLGSAPEVKTFGESDLLIRTLEEGDISTVQQSITQTLATSFPDSNPTIQKTDIVGPRFAADLKRGAIYSVLGSLLVIFVYILIRFEWRFGLGAVAALFHDVTITLGVFSILHGITPFSLQIDQTIIAAFLTIVGYSLNDTVVIFDRIREYANIFKTEPYPEMVNKSINHTLSRTIVTSGTTLLVVATLFIFGGEVLKGFAFALIIGILIGTYSSVFVAAPVVVELRARASSGRKSGK